MSQGMQFKRRQYNELKNQVESLQKEIDIDDAKKGERVVLREFMAFDPIKREPGVKNGMLIKAGQVIHYNEIPLLVKFLKAVAGKHGVKVE